MKRTLFFRWFPAVVWTALIAFLLTMPGSYVPGKAWSFDKVGHFLMFAGFAYLWARALGTSRRTMGWIAFFGILYGIGSEIAQEWLKGDRAGDPYDALADVLGLGAGLLAASLHERPDSEGGSK